MYIYRNIHPDKTFLAEAFFPQPVSTFKSTFEFSILKRQFFKRFIIPMTSVFLPSKNSKYCSTFSPELKKIILKRQIIQSVCSDLGFGELVGSKKASAQECPALASSVDTGNDPVANSSAVLVPR